MPFAFDDNLGRRTTLSRGNGTITSDTFDAASRLSSLTHDPADAGFDATFGNAYLCSGQPPRINGDVIRTSIA